MEEGLQHVTTSIILMTHQWLLFPLDGITMGVDASTTLPSEQMAEVLWPWWWTSVTLPWDVMKNMIINPLVPTTLLMPPKLSGKP